jgi:phasin family protein
MASKKPVISVMKAEATDTVAEVKLTMSEATISSIGANATAAPDTAVETITPSETATTAVSAKTDTLTVEKTEAQFKEMLNMDKAIKTAEEMVSFGQGNIEALLKSGQIWAAGVQDLGKHFAATAQAQMDETMATVKALSSVRSIKEAVELQTAMAKTTMEKLVAETGKLTDASMKLAEQTIAPITERVTLATEKFGRAV